MDKSIPVPLGEGDKWLRAWQLRIIKRQKTLFSNFTEVSINMGYRWYPESLWLMPVVE